MFLCLCVFVSVKQFLFCMDRRTDKRKMPDMRCACVSLISLAASSGRHQHAGSRHVELRHPSVGAGDQGGAFRRTLLHGGRHEGQGRLTSCFKSCSFGSENDYCTSVEVA